MKLSGLFAIGDHLKRLSETGEPLETLGQIIDFEAFPPSSGRGPVLFRWRQGRSPTL